MKKTAHQYWVLPKEAVNADQLDRFAKFTELIEADWRIASVTVVQDKVHYILRQGMSIADEADMIAKEATKMHKEHMQVEEERNQLMKKHLDDRKPWEDEDEET